MLREHPGVFIPPNRATFFFSQHYHMGVPWYERFFTNAGERVAGEVCEEYLSTPESPGRIRAYRPDMRLICCLRNPYERAISSWRFFGRNGMGEDTLAAQAQRYPAVIDGGCYATQLQVVRSLFDGTQVLIFLFEELSDPLPVARRLFEFIGVDARFVPGSLHRRINGNGRARAPVLARLVHDIHARSWGTSRIGSNAIGQLKRIRPLRRLVQTALYAQEPPLQTWREQLSQFPDSVIARYEREIGDLERMLDRDLSSWRAPRAGGRAVPAQAEMAKPLR